MKNIKFRNILLSLFAAVFMFGCDGFVQNIDDPIDNISDMSINNPSDIHALAIGVLNEWALTWDEHSLFMDGLADAMEFTRDIKGASYPTYESIDMALIVGNNQLDDRNNSNAAIFRELGRVRLYADTLVERITNRMTFKTADDSAARVEGLYYGYFFGAVSRYMYGYSWALTPTRPGGVINKSGLITSAEMYAEAIKRLDKALEFATPDQAKQVNSLKARIYMIEGKYAEAKAAAELGLAKGDDSFDAQYNTVGANQWYTWAGPGRTQFYAADRFGDYVYKDPKEAARIPLYTIKGSGKVTFKVDTVIAGISYKKDVETNRVYVQEAKYGQFGSPIAFLTWQENALMLAEIDFRQTKDVAAALKSINDLRAAYKLDPITEEVLKSDYNNDILELIYVERDKTLCFTGLRIMDQRRFGKWHLDPANTWQYLPISQAEKLANPNLK